MEIKCVNCGKEFILADGESHFYDKKRYPYPKRCKKCRDSNISNELNYKRNSFFDNAQQFGMPMNVSGGLYIEYTFIINCCIDSKNKYVVFDDSKGQVVFTNNEMMATQMTKDKAEKIVKLIEKKSTINNIRILFKSNYRTIRD